MPKELKVPKELRVLMPARRVEQVLLDYKVIQVIPEQILWFKGLREQ